MSEDIYNALLSISDEIRAIRQQQPEWLRLASGLVLRLPAIQRIQIYDNGAVTVYWSYDEGDHVTLHGDDAMAVMTAISRAALS